MRRAKTKAEPKPTLVRHGSQSIVRLERAGRAFLLEVTAPGVPVEQAPSLSVELTLAQAELLAEKAQALVVEYRQEILGHASPISDEPRASRR